jgi:hypothetical protein
MALTPEQQILGATPELQDVGRQRKLAELLMAQGMQQPQGQMISGQYVAPSFAQQLNPIANILAGQAVGERADTRQTELAAALRGRDAKDIQTYAELQKTDPARAIQFGLASQSPVLRNLVQEELKTQKYSEGEIGQRRNITTGQLETVGRGGEKYRAPIQIDTGTAIELRDPLDPTRVISRMPKSQMPAAGQVSEDGTYLIDTRSGRTTPIMGAGGQPLTGGGKPLNESQANSVAFGARALQADKIITDLENKGVKNTGLFRSTVAGTVGATPFIGDRLESGANALLNITASPEQQQTRQARQNFITAVLRKESGATIRPDEFKVEEEKYFPTINDDAKTIKQKQEARKLAIESLKAQAGPSGVRLINQITSQFQGADTSNVIDFNSLPKGR